MHTYKQALMDGLRIDPGFYDGAEKRLQSQRMETMLQLMKVGGHAVVDVVLNMVVDEARVCFYEGEQTNVPIGFFKRLSRCVFMRACMYVYTHTTIRTYIHVYVHTCAELWLMRAKWHLRCMGSKQKQTKMDIHTFIHAHIHTYTHT